jgi:type I restriction enzyme S subunit
MSEKYKLVRVGDLCNSISGLWTGKKPPFEKATVIRNTNFTRDCKLDLSNVAVLDVESKQLQTRKLIPGDLIVEKSGGGPKQAVGRVVYFNEPNGTYSLSNFTSALRLKDPSTTSPVYLQHFLYYQYVSGVTESMQSHSTGIRNLNIHQFLDIKVPLPSLEKQAEIVEKLDTAFAEIDLSYQKTLASLEYLTSCFDSFLDSILQDQILKFGQNKLVEVLDIARGGSPRPIDSFLTNDKDGVNWIKISDATSSKKYITETAQKIKPAGVSRSRLVNPGDFLLSNSMSFGRPYIMGTTGCIHDGWLVLSNNKKLLNQDYLYYVLGSKYIYEQFNRTAAGSTVRNLNISLAGQVTFPVPDLATQESLVSRLIDFETSIDELKESMTNKLSKLMELKSSFLSDAFGVNTLSEAVA